MFGSELRAFGHVAGDGRRYGVSIGAPPESNVTFYAQPAERPFLASWEEVDLLEVPHEQLLELTRMVGASPDTADVIRVVENVAATGNDHPFNHPPFPFVVDQVNGSWQIKVPIKAESLEDAIAKAWGIYRTIEVKGRSPSSPPTDSEGTR